MDDLIYNQHQVPKDQWRYGCRSTAATGCGWIATYNTLRLMDYRVSPGSLINFYEWQAPFLHGNLGTLPLAPAHFFKTHGFGVESSSLPEKFDEMAKAAHVCILYFRWQKGVKFGAHFVAVQYKDGRFTGYNTFKNSTGPDHYGPSLREFLKKQKMFAPVLIAIRDKR